VRVGGSLFALAAAAALLAGCLHGLENVTNRVDQFAYGGSFSGKDGAKTFTWSTTGPVAAVNWGTANADGGSVDVAVTDAAGKTVYQGSLAAAGPTAALADGVTGSGASQYSLAGEPGAWAITVTFHGYSGFMGLSVQKKGTAYDTSVLGDATASSSPPA
jgi:hypothetical protein